MYKTGTFNHGQGAVFIAATKLRTRKEPFIDIPLTIDTGGGRHWVSRGFQAGSDTFCR